MNMPLVNAIIARHCGHEVTARELVATDVDYIYVQDGNSPTLAAIFRDNGLSKVRNPENIGFFFDHSVLVPDRQMADRVVEAKAFAQSLGVRIFERGAGISHVVALEEGWFRPGTLVLGSDSHTCTGGVVQSLGLGMGATDIAAAMVTGKTWLRVPDTVWLKIEGTPHPATRPKDVLLHILRTFPATTFLYKSVQWIGPWVEGLSLDSAASLASMGVEMGAKCVFLPSGPGRPDGMVSLEPVDGGEVLTVSIDGLTPQIALPHAPTNVRPVDAVAGQSIDYVFLGSCTNSRLEDIAEFAEILRGRTVSRDVHCIVTPGSRSVYLEALRLGYVDILVRAGALVSPPGCGACVGTQGTIPAKGERVLSTMNRNFQGRMGNPEAEIFLSSPLVAANAAILGHIPACEEILENA